MVASRFSGLDFVVTHGRYAGVKDLRHQHLARENTIPIDMFTDAMNLFELVSSARALPNDENHWIGVHIRSHSDRHDACRPAHEADDQRDIHDVPHYKSLVNETQR